MNCFLLCIRRICVCWICAGVERRFESGNAFCGLVEEGVPIDMLWGAGHSNVHALLETGKTGTGTLLLARVGGKVGKRGKLKMLVGVQGDGHVAVILVQWRVSSEVS